MRTRISTSRATAASRTQVVKVDVVEALFRMAFAERAAALTAWWSTTGRAGDCFSAIGEIVGLLLAV